MQIANIHAWSAVQLATAGSTVFNVPPAPPADSGVLEPAPVAFSLPFAKLPQDIYPTTFLCLNTFQEATGTWPAIRVGGTTEDFGTFDPDLTTPNKVLGTTDGGQSITRYGTKFMQLVADYKGTVVFGLNRGANNLTNTIEAAKAAKAEIPTLYALELGNEPDVYPGTGVPIAANRSEWTIADDVASESEWQIAVGTALNATHIIQAASYYQSVSSSWSAEKYFNYSDPEALKYIAVFSHHNYPQTTINYTGGVLADLPALMSHINVTANVAPYIEDVKAANAKELQYVFGETNGVSGGGSPSQSPTFGTGLWVLDYTLQAASKNIARLYFHQGSPGSTYYMWWDRTGIRSPFYGGYVAAEAMAHGTHIVSLDSGISNYAGYAVYSDHRARKVVLINSDFFDGKGARPEQEFILTGLSGKTVTARRLTASSALSRQDQGDMPTFAGQTIDNETCKISGDNNVELIKAVNGQATVVLAASEALLISIGY